MGSHELAPEHDRVTHEGEFAVLVVDDASKIEELFILGMSNRHTQLDINQETTLPPPTTGLSFEIASPTLSLNGEGQIPLSIQTNIHFPHSSENIHQPIVDSIAHRIRAKTEQAIDYSLTQDTEDVKEYVINLGADSKIKVFVWEQALSVRAYSRANGVDETEHADRLNLQNFYIASISAIDAVTAELGGGTSDNEMVTIKIKIPEDQSSKEIALLDEPQQISQFDSVGGLTNAKERLREIGLAIQYPELAKEYGVEPTHFVLCGPPGTGKTSLIKAFATEFDAELLIKPSSTIVDCWLGRSAQNLTAAFNEALKISEERTVVLFFDEFDSIADKNAAQHREYSQLVNTLKQEIDRINQSKSKNRVILAAATNVDVMDLNDAIVRSGRIEPIAAPLPNEDERIDIWNRLMMSAELEKVVADTSGNVLDISVFGNDIDIPRIAQLTDEKSGADFVEMIKQVRKKKFHRAVGMHAAGKINELNNNRHLKQISQHDLETVIASFGL